MPDKSESLRYCFINFYEVMKYIEWIIRTNIFINIGNSDHFVDYFSDKVVL